MKSKDCNNSPKNKLMEDLLLALIQKKSKMLDSLIDEETIIVLPDGVVTEGVMKGACFDFSFSRAKELRVLSSLSHGKVGAVNASVQLTKTKKTHICAFFEFTSVTMRKVATIHLFQKRPV